MQIFDDTLKKVMRTLLLFVLTLLLPMASYTKLVRELDIPLKFPDIASISEKGFYIFSYDSLTVFFFPRDPKQPVIRFGGPGEGPAEFKGISFVKAYSDYLYVFTGEKIVYFSLQGKLLKEIRTEYGKGSLLPLGNNYASKSYINSMVNIKILDHRFQEKKSDLEISINPPNSNVLAANGKYDTYVVTDYIGYYVENDNLFVGNTQKGFYVGIYDANGKKLSEINRPYQKHLITSKDKEELNTRFRNIVGQNRFEASKKKNNRLFPTYYPAYENFFVSNNKLFFITFPIKEQKQEIVIMDLKGNVIKAHVIVTRYKEFYNIFNETIYYLHENDETEQWEIHEMDL